MLRQLQENTDRCIAQQLAVAGIEGRVVAAEQQINQLLAAPAVVQMGANAAVLANQAVAANDPVTVIEVKRECSPESMVDGG